MLGALCRLRLWLEGHSIYYKLWLEGLASMPSRCLNKCLIELIINLTLIGLIFIYFNFMDNSFHALMKITQSTSAIVMRQDHIVINKLKKCCFSGLISFLMNQIHPKLLVVGKVEYLLVQPSTCVNGGYTMGLSIPMFPFYRPAFDQKMNG